MSSLTFPAVRDSSWVAFAQVFGYRFAAGPWDFARRSVQSSIVFVVALWLAGEPVEIVDDEPEAGIALVDTIAELPLVSDEVARQAAIAGVESPKSYGEFEAGRSDTKKGDAARKTEGPVDEDEESQLRLRPFARPWSVVGVALEPIREANLLLPESLDPFTPKGAGPETAVRDEGEAEQEYIARLKRQRELLGTSTFFPSDPTKLLDVGWHFQVQLGGSFRAGNNSAGNLNSQLRSERHSLESDFLARLQAFYTQVEEGLPNRRVFGELNYDRNLRGRWICYAREELEYDEARLINIRTVTSGGIGFRFVDSIYERLVARTGPTATYVDYAPPGQSEDEFRSGWLIEGEYRRVLGESSRLEMTSTMFPDFDTDQAFRIRTEGAVLFPISRTSAWKWKIGVRHEYIMNPVQTTQPNDVEGYFSIVYTK